MAKRPIKKPNDDLSAINDLAVALIRRELQHYADSGERCPSALLSTAGAILRTYEVPEEVNRTAGEEAAQEAGYTFVTRIPPTSAEEICGRYSLAPTDHCAIAEKAREWLRKVDADSLDAGTLAKIVEEQEGLAAGE